MITEDYCSFEVSKLLKEKGFDEPCWLKYDSEGYLSFNHAGYINSEKPCDDFCALAPTHQLAMKWLREIHDILIVVSITYEKERYDWYICGIKGDPWKKELFHEERDVTYDTYEEAVEAALKYSLENLI